MGDVNTSAHAQVAYLKSIQRVASALRHVNSSSPMVTAITIVFSSLSRSQAVLNALEVTKHLKSLTTMADMSSHRIDFSFETNKHFPTVSLVERKGRS